MATFRKGEPRPANAGRRKGTINKTTATLKEMILGALQAKDGQKYLERQADENPGAFMTLLGKVLPTTLAGDPDHPLQVQHKSDAERAAEAVSLIDETFGLVMGVSKGTETVQ